MPVPVKAKGRCVSVDPNSRRRCWKPLGHDGAHQDETRLYGWGLSHLSMGATVGECGATDPNAPGASCELPERHDSAHVATVFPEPGAPKHTWGGCGFLGQVKRPPIEFTAECERAAGHTGDHRAGGHLIVAIGDERKEAFARRHRDVTRDDPAPAAFKPGDRVALTLDEWARALARSPEAKPEARFGLVVATSHELGLGVTVTVRHDGLLSDLRWPPEALQYWDDSEVLIPAPPFTDPDDAFRARRVRARAATEKDPRKLAEAAAVEANYRVVGHPFKVGDTVREKRTGHPPPGWVAREFKVAAITVDARGRAMFQGYEAGSGRLRGMMLAEEFELTATHSRILDSVYAVWPEAARYRKGRFFRG